MFTGLIQAVGTIAELRPAGSGMRLCVDMAGLADRAPPGASIAVNGTCLTVADRAGAVAHFDVAPETVRRSTLARARTGGRVNLEPALRAGDALDGHMVLGHVDATLALLARRALADCAVLRFALPEGPLAGMVAEKGSVALDGVSLTVAAMGPAGAERWFEISVIPQTLARTTLESLAVGGLVNFEADALARYAARWQTFVARNGGGLTEAWLREHGFAEA